METLNCIRCDFRHKDNGNCTAVGGFCTAVTAAHCPMLQKYLDTGLGPDEVTALQKDWSDLCTIVGECGGIDRLRELAEADKDGRVVVLPCKVGDSVYMISWRLNGRHEIEERVFSLTYFDPAKYGKDYFLSREEAEKALEEMKK
jgi:uncharacterized metal-binding protein YceD (DUF177 family)